MPAGHCYRHASRVARRVLRKGVVRARTGLVALGAGLGALHAAPLGGAMTGPAAVLHAAPQAVPDVPSHAAAPQDDVRMLAAALRGCAASLSSRERVEMARIIDQQSDRHGYDPLFITALVQVESGCVATARGGDALGLVQLLPATARGVARRAGVRWRGEQMLTEPSASLELGLRYLAELEAELGDPYRAVAAYNLGPARVARMSSGRAQATVYVRKILTRYERLCAEHA